jgi:hypothetical protein
MAKTQVIKNEFEPGRASDKYHTQYLQNLHYGDIGDSALEAFRSLDITSIDEVIKQLAEHARSSILLIGVGLVVVDREGIYEAAGYHSYLEYAAHLYEEAGVAPQTLSDAKIIAEVFLDHFAELKKAGFKIENNAHKLRYLEAALANHPKSEEEAYKRAAGDTFLAFRDWALTTRKKPRYAPAVKVTSTRIMVDGKNVLNIDEGLPDQEKRNLAGYLRAVYGIRATGNEPFILDTYDEGEQRAILNFQKKYRSQK